MTFEKIFTRIVEVTPQLATKNTHIIHEWLASGYDTDKDILPAIEETAKRSMFTIYSFNWFTTHIKRKHEERLKAQVAVKPKPAGRASYRAEKPPVMLTKEQREHLALGLKQLRAFLLDVRDKPSLLPPNYFEMRKELFKPRPEWRSQLTGKPLA